MEKKLFHLGEVKFAASTDTTTKKFSGYGAIFGNQDAYGDVIAKGAFADSIAANPSPLMFLNHNASSLPIGKWLSVSEDDIGLKVEGEFLDTQDGRDAYIAAKAGAISGLSIGFRALDFQTAQATADPARLITKIELLEISVVTFPANTEAQITDVKRTGDVDQIETFEAALANAVATIEAKYTEAAQLVAAHNLLSKLQGEI